MTRPTKYRRIGQMPVYRSFSPDEVKDAARVQMTVDEFEAIRLLDGDGLTQEACAARMHISRTTVTAIYLSARKKVADALVHGKQLLIVGGCCEFEPTVIQQTIAEKGSRAMRIAVSYRDGEVFQHFGQTEQFKLYDVEEGTIVNEQIVDTDGVRHGALAAFLKAAKADVLICGGIGTCGRTALAEAGVRLYPGASGSADEAVDAFVRGTLQYDPDARCDHHHEHHEHHGEGCGRHHEDDCDRHHEGGHRFGDEECSRRRAEGECARDNGECERHEGGHRFGDEECGRRRVEGECARDNGECERRHERHEGGCGGHGHCRGN
ncbi:MAG: DUF134 domain-containing protein [Clostridia bacterium]|nr:DUF134 domain-containing protein [Clostridia bacterium]